MSLNQVIFIIVSGLSKLASPWQYHEFALDLHNEAMDTHDTIASVALHAKCNTVNTELKYLPSHLSPIS